MTRGITSESIEVPKEAACSPVATTALPVPAVSLEEASLVSTVPPCIVAAAPPTTTENHPVVLRSSAVAGF